MKDYNDYVQAINNIFGCLEIMKKAWTTDDNLNYIKKIEDSKYEITNIANKIRSSK